MEEYSDEIHSTTQYN